MAKPGGLTPDDFVVEGQIGARALNVLIRVQQLVAARGKYRYLEVGSYLGRTLQPHLQSTHCTAVLSVDLRPDVTGDERGDLDMYRGITAQDMIDGLAQHCTKTQMGKLKCVTGTSDELRRMRVAKPYDLALIDGEHTNRAAFRDFLNVLRVIDSDGVICFDDSAIVLPGIQAAQEVLDDRGLEHHVAHGRGGMTVIGLGRSAAMVAEGLDADLTVRERKLAWRGREKLFGAHFEKAFNQRLGEDARLQRRAVRVLERSGYIVHRPALKLAAE